MVMIRDSICCWCQHRIKTEYALWHGGGQFLSEEGQLITVGADRDVFSMYN